MGLHALLSIKYLKHFSCLVLVFCFVFLCVFVVGFGFLSFWFLLFVCSLIFFSELHRTTTDLQTVTGSIPHKLAVAVVESPSCSPPRGSRYTHR